MGQERGPDSCHGSVVSGQGQDRTAVMGQLTGQDRTAVTGHLTGQDSCHGSSDRTGQLSRVI